MSGLLIGRVAGVPVNMSLIEIPRRRVTTFEGQRGHRNPSDDLGMIGKLETNKRGRKLAGEMVIHMQRGAPFHILTGVRGYGDTK